MRARSATTPVAKDVGDAVPAGDLGDPVGGPVVYHQDTDLIDAVDLSRDRGENGGKRLPPR